MNTTKGLIENHQIMLRKRSIYYVNSILNGIIYNDPQWVLAIVYRFSSQCSLMLSLCHSGQGKSLPEWSSKTIIQLAWGCLLSRIETFLQVRVLA